MALIKCRDCEREISDKIISCPHCGYVLEKRKNNVALIIIITIIGILTISISLIILFNIVNKKVPNNSVIDNGNSNETGTVTLENAGFNKVSLDKYLKLVKKTDKSIVLVARPSCMYCEKFAPILKQVMKDMNLTINYIDIDQISQEDWTTFTSSLTFLNDDEWGTPLLLIVQKGETIAINNGYAELDETKQFFTNNGFGK